MTLREMMERRAAIVAEMRGFTENPAGQGGDLSDEQNQRFDALKGDLGGIETRITRQQLVDDAERRMQGQPVGSGDNRFDKLAEGVSLCRAIMAFDPGIDAGREREVSREMERRTGRTARGILLPESVFVERRAGQMIGDDTKGGYVVGDMYRPDQLIDRLRAASALSAPGVTRLDGLVGRALIPRITGSGTVQWVAENAEPTESNLTFGQITLSPRTLSGQLAYSRQTLINAAPAIEGLIRDDLARRSPRRSTLPPSTASALSIRRGCCSAAICQRWRSAPTVALGANGAAPNIDAMLDLIGTVDVSNALAGNLQWLSNPKFVKTVAKIKDGMGQYMLLDRLPGALLGYPLVRSTSAPSNLAKGSGTNLSASIFGDWSSMLLGAWSGLDILSNPYSRAGSGQVLVHVFQDVDIQVRHIESFAAFVDAVTT